MHQRGKSEAGKKKKKKKTANKTDKKRFEATAKV